MNFSAILNNRFIQILLVSLVIFAICVICGLDGYIGFHAGSNGIGGDAGISRVGPPAESRLDIRTEKKGK